MQNHSYTKVAFVHFLLINIISFGWVFALPIMVQHMSQLFDGNADFFKLILLSTAVGLSTSLFFGRLLDKTSSRVVLTIGLILNLVFWIMLAFAESFPVMCVAFIIEGAAFSALMIARAPYFHELIARLKSESAYGRLESDAKMGMLAVLFLCLLGSGYLYQLNKALPFVLNAALVVITLLLIGRYASVKLNPERHEGVIKSSILKDLSLIIKKERPLFWLATTEGVFGALATYLFVIINVHLIDNGAGVVFIAYLIATVYLFRIAGAYMIRNDASQITIAIFLATYSLLIFSISWSVSALLTGLLFLGSSILREYIEIYLVADVTRKSPAHLKGTIRSYSEIVSNVSIIVVMLVMSFYADVMPSSFWVGAYGLLLGGCAVMFFLSLRADKSHVPAAVERIK